MSHVFSEVAINADRIYIITKQILHLQSSYHEEFKQEQKLKIKKVFQKNKTFLQDDRSAKDVPYLQKNIKGYVKSQLYVCSTDQLLFALKL